MDLRGFEYYAITGNPVSGASVTIREASLLHPNPNPIVATATTNGAGMWEATGLPEAAYDTEVVISNKTWRHKGMSKLSLSGMYIAGSPYQPVNWIKNGTFELWNAGNGPHTLTTTPTAFQPPFFDSIGTGSTGTLTRETVVVPTGSVATAKIVYVHSSGAYIRSYTIAGHVLEGLRGKNLVAQALVRQGAANQCAVRIYDGTTTTTGSRSITTGSFITLSATVAVPASATTIRVDIIGDVSGTFYLDQFMLAIGTTTGQFIPHATDTDGNDNYFASAVFTGNIAVAGTVIGSSTFQGTRFTSTIATGTSPFVVSSTTKVANLNADLLDDLDSAAFAQLAGSPTFVGNVTAPRFISNIATGTAPFGITSTTVVTNLNADLVDGAHVGTSGAAIGLLNAANTWSALQTHSANIAMTGTIQLLGGTNRHLASVDTGDIGLYGDHNMGTVRMRGFGASSFVYRQNAGSDQVIWHAGNDGTGSSLDADMVDGFHAASFALLSGGNLFQNDTTVTRTASGQPTHGVIYFGSNGGLVYIFYDGTRFNIVGGSSALKDGQTMWTAGNDGAGSGLDADLLDGLQATAFLNLAGGGANQTITFTGGSVVIGPTATPLAGLKVNGDLSVTGAKGRESTGKDQTQGIFHAIETPVPYFEEVGRAKTDSHGRAVIMLPEDYVNHVATDDYCIQVTPHGAAALYVARKDSRGFVVETLLGDDEIAFDWRVTARQYDMQHVKRLGGSM